MVKGISRKEFNAYVKEMWRKLKEGEKKYGMKFDTTNIKKEMLEEAVDLSNYSFMLYLQATKFGGKNE